MMKDSKVRRYYKTKCQHKERKVKLLIASLFTQRQLMQLGWPSSASVTEKPFIKECFTKVIWMM